MAVLQMQRMNLVAMKQNRKAILERLQELGALEIDVPMEETEGIMREDTSGQKAEFEKQASLADQALEILDKYAPEKTSLFAALAGKPRSAVSSMRTRRKTARPIWRRRR